MTEETWNIVKIAISRLENPPPWLNDLAQRSYAEIKALPKLDNIPKGQIARPVIEEKPVTPDYLDFLREQIQLNARGKEWSEVLQKRLNALQPFMGKMLVAASFHRKPNSTISTIDSITLKVNRETGKLVFFECL